MGIQPNICVIRFQPNAHGFSAKYICILKFQPIVHEHSARDMNIYASSNFSRMYMGMHTLADIIGGLLAASALLFFLIPLGHQNCKLKTQTISLQTNKNKQSNLQLITPMSSFCHRPWLHLLQSSFLYWLE